jgi:lipopolysaccharide transport system permease protein
VTESPLTGVIARVSGVTSPAGRGDQASQLPITVISPDHRWFDWRLRQLWRYRDLIRLFVWRDFVAVYKQTILGPAWHILRPLLTTIVFTVVFGRVAGLSTDGAPAFLFYLSGFVVWNYFAVALDNVSKTFVANSSLLGKVYFHRLVIPVSLILSNLISFGINLALVLVVLAAYVWSGAAVHLTFWVLATPLLLAIVAGYALAVGLIVCSVTTRYRDLTYLVTFGIQLFMYLTPVIYPVSAVAGRYRQLIILNPLTPLIEGFRLAIIGVGTVTWLQVLASALGMLLALTIGLVMFSRTERTFMDTV